MFTFHANSISVMTFIAQSYELMLQCWHLNPDLRPTPHDIVAQLTPSDSILDDVDSEVNGGHQVGEHMLCSGSVWLFMLVLSFPLSPQLLSEITDPQSS